MSTDDEMTPLEMLAYLNENTCGWWTIHYSPPTVLHQDITMFDTINTEHRFEGETLEEAIHTAWDAVQGGEVAS